MNCTQAHELLPLFAGRDLDEKRARLVTEHVQSCAACARVADEYRETIELTQHFAAPAFSDIGYARVRGQVLQQIEREVATPLLPKMFGSWFQPRVAWAVASALIISLGFFALYLVVNRTAEVQPVAKKHPQVNVATTLQPTAIPRTTQPGSEEKKKPVEDKGKGIRRSVNRLPKAVDSSSRAASVSPELDDPEAVNSLPAVNVVPDNPPMRVEMQTKDPNIRIIWFSQPNTKPSLPNSKGI